MNSTVLRRIALACTLALGWIVLAHLFRHSGDTDPAPVRWALSAMGLWFVACGAWGYARAPTPLGHVFLWHGALSGVHWGGPVGIGPEPWRTFELALFVVAGVVLAQSVFLDLARRLGAPQPRWTWAAYLPALIGAALLVVLFATGADQAALGALSALYAVGILLSLVGGVMLMARPIMSGEQRPANAVVAVALFVAWAPHAAVAGGLIEPGAAAGLFNLPLALVPTVLAWRIARTPAA